MFNPKVSMLALIGVAALASSANDTYSSSKDYSSSSVDIGEIEKARRRSRRNKSMKRFKKKR